MPWASMLTGQTVRKAASGEVEAFTPVAQVSPPEGQTITGGPLKLKGAVEGYRDILDIVDYNGNNLWRLDWNGVARGSGATKPTLADVEVLDTFGFGYTEDETSFSTISAKMSGPYAGNVGIGTKTPGSKLDVDGDVNLTGDIKINGNQRIWDEVGGNYTAISGASGKTIYYQYLVDQQLEVYCGSGNQGLGFGKAGGSMAITSFGTGAYPPFPIHLNSLANAPNTIINPLSGNVGIGTTEPTEQLEVKGNVRLGDTAQGYYVNLESKVDAINPMNIRVSLEPVIGQVDFTPGTGDYQAGTYVNGYYGLSLCTNAGSVTTPGLEHVRLHIDNDGKVGIGTLDPTSKFTVNGNVEIQTAGLIFSKVPYPNCDPIVAEIVNEVGNIEADGVRYCVTFVTVDGETTSQGLSAPTVGPQLQKVRLSNIPVSTHPAVIARNVYRVYWSGVANTWGQREFCETIANNTETVWVDNNIIPDSFNAAVIGNKLSEINTTGGGLVGLSAATFGSNSYMDAASVTIYQGNLHNTPPPLRFSAYDSVTALGLYDSAGVLGLRMFNERTEYTDSRDCMFQIAHLDNNVAGIQFQGSGIRNKMYTDAGYRLFIESNDQYRDMYGDTQCGNVIIASKPNGTGRVGIDVEEPIEKLDVAGNIRAENLITSNGTVSSRFGTDGSGAFMACDTPNRRLSFYTTTLAGDLVNAITVTQEQNIGIGTTSPVSKLHVTGKTLADVITTDIGLDFNLVEPPTTALTAALGAGTDIEAATYRYIVAFVTAIGQTQNGPESDPIVTDGLHNIHLTNIPISSDPQVTGRRIYRSSGVVGRYEYYLVGYIQNNTATELWDAGSHEYYYGNRGGVNPWYNQNTTNRFITVNGDRALFMSDGILALGYQSALNLSAATTQSVFLGAQAGRELTDGKIDTFIGHGAGVNLHSGNDNTFVGGFAAQNLVSGNNNTCVGSSTGANMGAYAENNTYIGCYAGFTGQGSLNVFIGSQAGYYETGNAKLYIDDRARASEADGRLKALVYGQFAEDPANQLLRVNGIIESSTGGVKFPDGSVQTTKADNNFALAMSIALG